MVGHSSGEIAAAYVSQAITANAAIIIAYYRGQVTSRQFRAGGMAAVAMGREMVAPYLGKGVVIACENSPSSVTLSGDKKELNSTVVKITAEKPEIFVRHLKVETAYHSRKCSMATIQRSCPCLRSGIDVSQITWKRLVMSTKDY